MARKNFAVEQGYDIYDVNGNILSAQLSGSAAPGGDTGPQDDAPIGSLYQRTDGSFYLKTANAGALADWKIVPVELGSGYAAVNGTVAIGDSFEEAVEKLAGNQDDIQTASGLSQGDVDYGTFTGSTLSDNEDSKALFQELETAHEEVDQNVDDLITLSGMPENSVDNGTFSGGTIPDSSTTKDALQSLETAIETIEGGFADSGSGVTTITVIDSLLVDDVHSAEWELVVWEEATPANKIFQKITALHNGTAAADATSVDDSVHTKLKVGSNFNLSVDTSLNGAGAAQEMRISLTSTSAGVAYEVRRTGVLVAN